MSFGKVEQIVTEYTFPFQLGAYIIICLLVVVYISKLPNKKEYLNKIFLSPKNLKYISNWERIKLYAIIFSLICFSVICDGVATSLIAEVKTIHLSHPFVIFTGLQLLQFIKFLSTIVFCIQYSNLLALYYSRNTTNK